MMLQRLFFATLNWWWNWSAEECQKAEIDLIYDGNWWEDVFQIAELKRTIEFLKENKQGQLISLHSLPSLKSKPQPTYIIDYVTKTRCWALLLCCSTFSLVRPLRCTRITMLQEWYNGGSLVLPYHWLVSLHRFLFLKLRRVPVVAVWLPGWLWSRPGEASACWPMLKALPLAIYTLLQYQQNQLVQR